MFSSGSVFLGGCEFVTYLGSRVRLGGFRWISIVDTGFATGSGPSPRSVENLTRLRGFLLLYSRAEREFASLQPAVVAVDRVSGSSQIWSPENCVSISPLILRFILLL